MMEGEPPQENHTPGAGQHGNAIEIFGTYDKRVAARKRTHTLKRDVILRRQTENIITSILHKWGRLSYDSLYERFHANNPYLLPYLIHALACLQHRGNNQHEPDIVSDLQDGRRVYFPNPWCDGELERDYQEARELWMSYRQGLILDEDLEDMWNDSQGWE